MLDFPSPKPRAQVAAPRLLDPSASLCMLQGAFVRVGARTFVVLSHPSRAVAARSTRKPTKAEIAVVRLALRGLPHSAIARARGVSRRTVVNQLGSLYRKLGCTSRAELLAQVAARGQEALFLEGDQADVADVA